MSDYRHSIKQHSQGDHVQRDSFKFNLAGSKPAVHVAGGAIQEAKKDTFPALEGLAIFLLALKPGAVRIPHWHPDANELDYILQGTAQIAIVGPDSAEETFKLTPGEIGFIPQGWFHSIQNIGEDELRMLVIFNNDNPNDIGISIGLGGMSGAVLGETLGVPASTFTNFNKDVKFIAPQ
jgi:oxalate decarboxylase